MPWDIKTIESYIDNQVEENINLDYKAADALQKTDGKKKEISKDVSALANAAGGTIIYGVKEFAESAKRHLPEKIDPLLRTDISKEWLEQVINTNIQPKVEGIIITPVTVDDSKGTVVYVVEVPQSTTAHQAIDKKYYKRYNFESVPMEDYEIRDIMSRLKHPEVTLEFVLECKRSIVEFSPHKRLPQDEFTLRVAIRNKGKVVANYVNYYLELPESILADGDSLSDSETQQGYKNFYGENTVRDVVDLQSAFPHPIKKYGPSRFDPVLPGTKSRSETISLNKNLDIEEELHWTIYADNAEMKTGSISFSELIANIKFSHE